MPGREQPHAAHDRQPAFADDGERQQARRGVVHQNALVESISSVTGPSLTSSTAMWARNTPVATGTPACAHRGDHRLVERVGRLRRRGVDVGRPASAAAVAEQRELRDDEHAALDVGDGEVHLAGVVLEDAQRR